MALYYTICADPPWAFNDTLPGPTRGADKNYSVLGIDDICAFEPWPGRIVADCANDDAILFLWRVSSQVEEAYRVVRAWGFVPKAEIIWLKLTTGGKRHFGMGRYVRAEHETCVIATRGRPKVLSRSIRSTFEAHTRRHSEKPEYFYIEIVEKLSPGPYLELFARRRRPGWTCLGAECR